MNDKERQQLRKYLDRIEAAENWRDSAYKDLWQRCYKRYRNYVDKLYDPNTGREIKDRSNISIPYTFTQVETVLPRLVESLFAARPYVTVKGREPSDEPNAKNMETLLDWQMNERLDIQDIFHKGLKEMCIYGTAVAYVGWKYKERKVIRRQLQTLLDENNNPIIEVDPTTGEEVEIADYAAVEVTETVWDDPDVKFIDLGLFFVDPNATDIDDARYCGHVAYLTKSELEDMAERDESMKLKWDEIPKDYRKNNVRNERMAAVGLPSVQEENVHDDDDRLYEVHYYWEDDKEVIIINRAYLAKDGDNPYWHKKKPYVKDVYTEVPHEFYGIGLVEMIEDLQDELNAERNMRIDYRAMNLRRMWKVRRGANIKLSDLRWRQNGIIRVDEMDDLQEIETAHIGNDSFNQEGVIKQDIRDTTGAHDVVMGTSGGSATATETMTKDNNASIRFRLIISSVEKRLLVGVTNLMIKNNQQFIDRDLVFRVTGEEDEWVEMSPEDIQGQFDLMAAGSSVEPLANKEAFKQRMIELYGVLSSDPFMQMYPEKRRNLLKKVLEAFDIKNTEELLPSEEDLMMEQQMMQEQQMIEQQLQGLPPEVRQDVMNQLSQIGGGANTAQMQEPALNVIGGGGFG